MRTHKLGIILLHHADASDKREDSDEEAFEDEGCTRQKCRVWFHLSQELTAICCVAFLLLVCLPVLAFWFMFVGILVSSGSIFVLLRRLWKDAHSGGNVVLDGRDVVDGEDIEFQEFLSNFETGTSGERD
jgi:hypothetical protein